MPNKVKIKESTVVALSGGVDSSVAAGILKQKGYKVSGAFLRFWNEKEDKYCGDLAETKARETARILQIPFYTLNVEKEFKQQVISYFLSELRKGKTPNPCVVCNREIKFKILISKLSAPDVFYVSTGHYVRKKKEEIFMGKDKKKDQSYFLWSLKKEWIKKLLFPLGGLSKKQVKEKAEKWGLPTANAPDSQEICFINNDLEEFLKKHMSLTPGKIVDEKGNILGEHNGLPLYTIGQRKGLRLSGGPFYVLRKVMEKNELVVTQDEKKLARREVFFNNANFLSEITPPLDIMAKIRYKSKSAEAKLYKEKIIFSSLQRAVTPGQSVVFYRNEKLLGGGIIVEKHKA